MTHILPSDQSSRRVLYAIIVLSLLGVLLKFAAAAPVWLHYDENYYLNIGQNFVDRGELTPYMWRLDSNTNIVAGSGSGYGIYLLVGWMKLVGVTLVNARLLMIGLNLLTAVVMYFVAQKWWESRAAGVAALVFTLVSTSPVYSFIVRMDAPGMLAYSLVLLLHIHAVREHKPWLHVTTGVAVVLSAEFHIIGIVYGVALSVWYAITFFNAIRVERRLTLNTGPVYFGLGGLVAGSLYIMVHILPDPAAYFSIPSSCFQCDPSSFNELIRYARLLLLRPVEFFLLFLTVITALYRHRPADRHFLILIITWLIALPLTGVPPFTHYTYHFWPLLAIGTAGFLMRGLQPTGRLRPWRTGLGIGLAVVSLVFNAGAHLAEFQPFELRKPIAETAAMAAVRAAVPVDVVVMGDVGLYYYLSDYHNFMSYRDTDEHGATQRGETQLEYWQREQPLVIIGDYRADDPELDQYMSELDFAEAYPDVWVAASLRDQLDLNAEG